MAVKFSNNAVTTLSASISAGATSFTVASASTFPTLSGSDWTYVSLTSEVVKVTAISGTTFTCDATSTAHASGESVELRMTAELLNDFAEDTEAVPVTGGTFTGAITAPDFIGPLNGAIQFTAKNTSGGTITKGQAIAISGISGNTPTVTLADADATTMPAFGLAGSTATDNNTLEIITFGSLKGVKTDYASWALGDTLYISTTAGTLTNVAPSGEAAKIQNIGTVERLHSSNGTIKVGGAGRSNATPNLDDGNIFIGNASNQAVSVDLSTVSLPLAGGTMTGDVSLGDNVKALFGAGNDLQIYHDGSHSTIQDAGTGRMFIKTNGTDISLSSTSDIMLKATVDGSVDLYHNNSKKLATTSTGIDVTGRVTCDGVTSNGVIEAKGDGTVDTSRFKFTNTTSGSNGWLGIPAWDNDAMYLYGPTASAEEQAAKYTLATWIFSTAGSERMRIDSSGNVGIGTANPAGYRLNVSRGATGNIAQLTDGVANTFIVRSNANTLYAGNANNYPLAFVTSNTERMRIDSSGNVGIGTSSLNSNKAVIEGGVAGTHSSTLALKTGSGANSQVADLAFYGTFVSPTADKGQRRTADITSGFSTANWGTEYLAFGVGGASDAANVTSEKVRILSSGGITFNGDTAAANALDDYEEGTFNVDILRNGVASTNSGLNGYYVKVGRMVHITISTGNGYCSHSSGASGVSVTISGSLPFVPAMAGGSRVVHSRTMAYPEKIGLGWQSGSATIYLQTTTNNYPVANNVVSLNTQTNTSLIWSGSYYTNS